MIARHFALPLWRRLASSAPVHRVLLIVAIGLARGPAINLCQCMR
jgi:hypothetical protein